MTEFVSSSFVHQPLYLNKHSTNKTSTLTCLWYIIISSVCACLPEKNCRANSLYWQYPTTQILVRIPRTNIHDFFYKGNHKQHNFYVASRSNRTKYIHKYSVVPRVFNGRKRRHLIWMSGHVNIFLNVWQTFLELPHYDPWLLRMENFDVSATQKKQLKNFGWNFTFILSVNIDA